jgi:hypothetical protein
LHEVRPLLEQLAEQLAGVVVVVGGGGDGVVGVRT